MVRSDVPDYYDRYIHRREKYHHAVEQGAAGFVYRNHVEGCLPPTGSVGWHDEPIGPIPAVGVSSEVGARLGRRFDGESITVAVEATIQPAESQNVHAELGPDTDERVLVTSHVDAHDIAEGAMDNGAGTAMIVEIATALAAREDDLETRVEFVGFGAEEVGLLGSRRYAERADHDAIERSSTATASSATGRSRSLRTGSTPWPTPQTRSRTGTITRSEPSPNSVPTAITGRSSSGVSRAVTSSRCRTARDGDGAIPSPTPSRSSSPGPCANRRSS